MKKSLFIIDDFLNDPDTLRAAALAQEYPEPEGVQNYPGRDSRHRQIINGFDQKIAEIVGETVEPAGAPSHAKFRLALEGDKGRDGVHIDPVNWTAILYLTLPEHCRDGTHLFRHKETGTDHAPYNEQELAAMGFTSKEAFMSNVLDRNTNNPDAWELLMTVPMRYNRLLIIRPQQYHDAGVSFGDSPQNGRLVYLTTYF